MLRHLSQPCGEATPQEHSPRAVGGGFGTRSHAQPPLDSHMRGPPDLGQRGHAAGPRGVTTDGPHGSWVFGADRSTGTGGPGMPRTGAPRTRGCMPVSVLDSACVSRSISTCSDSPRSSVRWHFQWLHSVSSWGHTCWSRAGRWLPHCPHYTCLLISALVHKSMHEYVTPSFAWILDM